jgi:DNA-directed RNA polymerase subunit RPC12/RpoP
MMITYADIKCFNCGNSFPVYWPNWEKNLPIECPFCGSEFNDEMTKRLRNALGTVSEFNAYLRSRHADGRSHDLFQVDFKHVYVSLEKYHLIPQKEETPKDD